MGYNWVKNKYGLKVWRVRFLQVTMYTMYPPCASVKERMNGPMHEENRVKFK